MGRLRLRTRRGELDVRRLSSVWSWFARYSRAHLPALLLAGFASFCVVAAQLAAPWPLKVILDSVLSGKSGGLLSDWIHAFTVERRSVLLVCCVLILAIALLEAVVAYARDVLLAQTGQEITGKIRQDLFRHLKTLPPVVFERRSTGSLLTRLTGDIQMLRQMLVDSLVSAGQNTLLIAGTLVAMFWMDPALALIGLSVVPLTLAASWGISRSIRSATQKAREKESQVAAIAHDVLGAMAIVQAFNREAIEQKRFTRENRSTVRAGVRTTRLESRLFRLVSVASALALAGIVYVGAGGVLAGRMTAGELIVFIAYLRMINRPLREYAKIAGQAAKGAACGQRLAELLAIRPAVANLPNAIELREPRGEIRFERVSFEYEPGRRVLHEVSFELRAGERAAIVGRTGAGKSTLVKLLLRFHDPCEGRVCVDGFDLRDLSTDSLRAAIGWVHQDTVLFGMTVAENLALGRADATREEIEDVARRVQADEFIRALPQGYDTVLGQNGVTLSGGQRQRLALGRALLRRPSILLLDEPATGLDARTRRIVEDSWHSPASRATTLVICHRLHDMARFDRVVLMDEGRVLANGTHAELLASCEEYSALCRAAVESPVLRIPEPAA